MSRRTSAIMVARTANLDRTKEMASYGCTACENTTTVQASIARPFCVHCGSDALTAREQASVKGKTLQRSQDSELASVKCPGCSSHLIMTVATASAHAHGSAGHLNCPACSHEIAFEAPQATAAATVDDESWDETVSTDDATDEGADIHKIAEDEVLDPALDNREEQPAEVAGEESTDEDEDTLIIDESNADSGDADEEGEGETESKGDDDDSEEACNKDKATAGDESTDEDEDDAEADTGTGDESTDEDEDAEKVDEEEAAVAASAPIIGTESVEVKLHQVCAGVAPTFEVVGDTIQCKQGSVITATRVCSEGENSNGLVRAIARAAESNELDALLSSNGFEIATVTISVARVAEIEADQHQKEVASAVDQVRTDTGVVLRQSMGIALCGLNRGFFKAENPLFKAIATAFGNEGIDEDRVEEILSDCLNDAGDDFADTVVDLAMEQLVKTPEVRNELASTVMSVRVPKAVASVAGKKPALARDLMNPLKPSTATRKETAATVDQPTSKIAALAARLPAGRMTQTH